MTIRDFQVEDWDRGFLACLNALSPTPELTNWQVCIFQAVRQAAKIRTLVAVDEFGRVTGTLSLFIEPKFLRGNTFVGHIEDVAVHPLHQKKGVGKALVEHAVQLCRDKGCYKVLLDCSPSLEPYYSALGFTHHSSGMRRDMRCESETSSPPSPSEPAAKTPSPRS